MAELTDKQIQEAVRKVLQENSKAKTSEKGDVIAEIKKVSEKRSKTAEEFLSNAKAELEGKLSDNQDISPILDIITKYTGYSQLDIPGGEEACALNVLINLIEYMINRKDINKSEEIKNSLSKLAENTINLYANYISNY